MKNNKKYYCLIPLVSLLSGCFEESELETDTRLYIPYSLNNLHYPNDLMLTDSDGTVALPIESTGDYVDFRDYENVYGALDGWSTGYQIVLPLEGSDLAINIDSLTDNIILYDVKNAKRLKYGDDFVASINDKQDLVIKPTVILPEASTFILAVTDGVKNSKSEGLKAAYEYEKLAEGGSVDNPLSEQAASQLQRNHALLEAAGVTGEIVYSSEFTTQSIYPVMDAAIKNIPEQPLNNITVLETPDSKDYETYSATIFIPYYLDMPERGSCEVPYSYEPGTEEYIEVIADPIGKCEALYSWWRDPSDGFIHGGNTNLEVQSKEKIPVVIYAPKGADLENWEEGGATYPTSIFVHGITGRKESTATMVESITNSANPGLVIAIDQPLHGERGINLDFDLDLEISASSNAYKGGDKAVYLNLLSPLTLRDNQRQAVLDQLALRKALNRTGFINKSNVNLIGHSLGGIVATMVSEMSQSTVDSTKSELAFTTVSLVVPGMHLTELTMNSPLLGEEVEGKIKDSADVQLAVASMLGLYDETQDSRVDGIKALEAFKEVPENLEKANSMVDMVYNMIMPDMKKGIQAAVDAGDPANFTLRQSTNSEQPILLVEAAGNCEENGATEECEVGDYLPDTVVVNDVAGLPLVGTEPLISQLGLTAITGTEASLDPLKRVLRIKTGGHGTYLFGYEGPMNEDGVPGNPLPVREELNDSLTLQQKAVASFVNSGGKAVTIDPDYIDAHVKMP